jgi:hypothetical protein
MSRRTLNRGLVATIAATVLFWVGLAAFIGLWLAPGHADAMTAADIPAIPAQAVEVCDHLSQTVCPIVTGAPAMWVTAPATIIGMPPYYGRIVRFIANANGQPGAWVRLVNGGELYFELSYLTLSPTGGTR